MNLYESIKKNLKTKERISKLNESENNLKEVIRTGLEMKDYLKLNGFESLVNKIDDDKATYRLYLDPVKGTFSGNYKLEKINESCGRKKKIKIKESNLAKYLGVAQSLTEKVNHANDDINAKILEALRSKYKAKKYADDFKKAGITVDDSPREGVTLIGPNGKRLSADRLEIHGPAKPGHNNTHGGRYGSRIKSKIKDLDNYNKRIAEQKENIENLKNAEHDDIIRKYPNKTTEEALKAHEDNIASEESSLNWNKRWRKDTQKDIAREHRNRAEGHNSDLGYGNRIIDRKSSAIDKIDYKGYLDSKDNDINKDFTGGGYVKPTPGQQVRQDLKNAKDKVNNTYYRWDAQDVARDRKIDAKAIEARKKEIEEEYKKKMDDEVNRMLERKSKADSSYKDHKEYYRKNVNDLNAFRKQHNLPTKDEDSFDDYLEKKANSNW